MGAVARSVREAEPRDPPWGLITLLPLALMSVNVRQSGSGPVVQLGWRRRRGKIAGQLLQSPPALLKEPSSRL